MTEETIRTILRDWMAEIGISVSERSDATADVDYVTRSLTTEKYDAYDNAMTFAEKRLGLALPTSVDAHDLILEYAAKLWLCGRILAREIGDFDVGDKKAAKIFENAKAQRDIISQEYKELREEVWGKGVSNQRTTTGDLEVVTHSIVSNLETEIENEDVLELDT